MVLHQRAQSKTSLGIKEIVLMTRIPIRPTVKHFYKDGIGGGSGSNCESAVIFKIFIFLKVKFKTILGLVCKHGKIRLLPTTSGTYFTIISKNRKRIQEKHW